MKKSIFLTLSAIVLFFCGSAYGSKYDRHTQGLVHREGDYIYIHSPHEVPVKGLSVAIFRVSDLPKTTKEFRECINDGWYDGLVATKTTDSIWQQDFGRDVEILSEEATCKRIDSTDRFEVNTIVGTIEYDKTAKALCLKEEIGFPNYFVNSELRSAPADFLECINYKKHKGKVELKIQIGSQYRDSTILRINKATECKRL